MRLISSLFMATALSFAAGTAMAACPEASTGIDASKTAGIAKDGSMAPLQGAEPGANRVAKDGSTMPLATEQGGGDKNLATSQQDIEAQQKGGKTAAATAEDEKCKDSNTPQVNQ